MKQVNYDRRNLLHFAAKSGYLDAVKFLVSIGLDINTSDRWGATPLNYARA
jgi:ankyrin repeat protein